MLCNRDPMYAWPPSTPCILPSSTLVHHISHSPIQPPPDPHRSVIKLLVPTLCGGITMIPLLLPPLPSPLCRASQPCAVLHVSFFVCFFFTPLVNSKTPLQADRRPFPSFCLGTWIIAAVVEMHLGGAY